MSEVRNTKPTAGGLIRDARVRAGMSQAQLALAAGVAQPVISAYENERREPSLPMIAKLIEATGHDLVIDLTRRPLPAGSRLERLRHNRHDVIRLAARRGAHNLRVFGSTARGEDTEASDIDLLVDLDDGVSLLDLITIEDDLTNLLGTKVEVIPANELKPHVKESALADAIPL